MPWIEPFMLETIMCFTLNSALLWTGSIFQVVTAADVAGEVAMVEAPYLIENEAARSIGFGCQREADATSC
jgi:hypothetical protein